MHSPGGSYIYIAFGDKKRLHITAEVLLVFYHRIVNFGKGIVVIVWGDHFAWDVELMYRYQQTSSSEKYDWNNQEYQYTDIY